tara:strand:- start:129 stop:527 length:399 start_codon:yes stop_codon:yes gene_type:complete
MPGKKIDLFNHDLKKSSIEDVRFAIENLLSADNLMDSDSVQVLQHYLNRYVAGAPVLDEDGIFGSQTMRMVQTYRNENRYWKPLSLEPESPITIDPMFTSMEYDNNVEKLNYERYIKAMEEKHYDGYYGTGK